MSEVSSTSGSGGVSPVDLINLRKKEDEPKTEPAPDDGTDAPDEGSGTKGAGGAQGSGGSGTSGDGANGGTNGGSSGAASGASNGNSTAAPSKTPAQAAAPKLSAEEEVAFAKAAAERMRQLLMQEDLVARLSREGEKAGPLTTPSAQAAQSAYASAANANRPTGTDISA